MRIAILKILENQNEPISSKQILDKLPETCNWSAKYALSAVQIGTLMRGMKEVERVGKKDSFTWQVKRKD